MFLWTMRLLIGMMAVTISLANTSAKPSYASALRIQHRSCTPTKVLPPRRIVIVNEFTENNIVSYTYLRVLANQYNFQRNLGKYTQDSVEYMQRLITFLEKQDNVSKAASATVKTTVATKPSEAAQAAELIKVERKFSVRIDTLRGLNSILTDMGKLVNLKKRMIEVATQIEVNTKQMNTHREIGALEIKLELQASTILEGIMKYSRNGRTVVGISKLNSLRSQLKNGSAFVKSLDNSKKGVLAEIAKWKSDIQKEFLDDFDGRIKKLTDLYAQNRLAMERIIGVYCASGDFPLNEKASEQVKDLTNEHFRRETLIQQLEDGMAFQQKSFKAQLARGQQLSDSLQKILATHREKLASNAKIHSELYSNAVSAVKAIRKGIKLPPPLWVQKEWQGLKVYNAYISALTAKINAFRQMKADVKVNFQKYDELLKKNQKELEFLNIVLQRAQDAFGAHQATKLGYPNLNSSFDAFASSFPQLLKAAADTIKPLFASTWTAVMELEVVLAKMEQAAVTEPLRRFLGSFLREQESAASIKAIFRSSGTHSQRSSLRKTVGPVPEVPLKIQAFSYNGIPRHIA